LNALMWSHYGDSHRGFVVEFYLETGTLNRHFGAPFEVEYSSTRPSLDVSMDLFNNDPFECFKKTYLQKSNEWEYEKEYRCMFPNRPAGIVQYDQKNILCSVIAGSRMDKKASEKLKEIVRERSCILGWEISFYQAEQCKSTYSIIVPGHPRCNTSARYPC